MPFGQFLSDREAQAGATLALGRIKGLEDPQAAIDRNPGPIVLDEDFHLVLTVHISSFDLDPAPIRNRIDGISQEVEQDLVNGIGVDRDRRLVWILDSLQLDLASSDRRLQGLGRLSRQSAHDRGGEVQASVLGVGEHVEREGQDSVEVAGEDGPTLASKVDSLSIQGEFDGIRPAPHALENVLDRVAQSRGGFTHRSQSLQSSRRHQTVSDMEPEIDHAGGIHEDGERFLIPAWIRRPGKGHDVTVAVLADDHRSHRRRLVDHRDSWFPDRHRIGDLGDEVSREIKGGFCRITKLIPNLRKPSQDASIVDRHDGGLIGPEQLGQGFRQGGRPIATGIQQVSPTVGSGVHRRIEQPDVMPIRVGGSESAVEIRFIDVRHQQHGVPTLDSIARGQRDPIEQQFTVEEGPIGAVEVSKPPTPVIRGQFGVSTADRIIAQGDRFSRAADQLRLSIRQWMPGSGIRSFDDDEGVHVPSLRIPTTSAGDRAAGD